MSFNSFFEIYFLFLYRCCSITVCLSVDLQKLLFMIDSCYVIQDSSDMTYYLKRSENVVYFTSMIDSCRRFLSYSLACHLCKKIRDSGYLDVSVVKLPIDSLLYDIYTNTFDL